MQADIFVLLVWRVDRENLLYMQLACESQVPRKFPGDSHLEKDRFRMEKEETIKKSYGKILKIV